MIQDQLVDYISSQLKLGVSRDAIKAALISAGWLAADVEDTLKKVDGGAPTQQPAAMKPAGAMSVGSSFGASPAASAKNTEPQMIRVSDLVSSSPAKSSPSQFGGKISGNSFEASPAARVKATGSSSGVLAASGGDKKILIGGIVAVVLIVLFGGLAGYFYSINAGLAAQVATLNGASGSVNTQLSALKSQFDASSTALAAQIATLTSANADLALDLSFYVTPSGSILTTGTTLPITVSGLLSNGGKAPYIVTTSHGAKIFVANSADAKIAAQLKPLIGTTVQLIGTYVPGSDQMTVASVATSTAQ